MARRTAGCVSTSGTAAGVVTTSTGPWRSARAASRGVVSTTSPRKAVWITRLLNPEHREERFLRDLHGAYLLHPSLAFLLLLEQLALAGDVAAVALGGHVLAQRPDVFPGDDPRPDRGLDRHLELLARDQLPQPGRHGNAVVACLVGVDDLAERVHRLALQQDVDLHQVGLGLAGGLVVKRGVAAGARLELVEEVEDDLGQGHRVADLHPVG